MFKQFFWKILLCTVPVLLASLVIAGALYNEIQQVDRIGDLKLPRFKLGTDLAGGTILVYEIDTRKLSGESEQGGVDPKAITAILAEKLKQRIDPNDLYNVVIRPAGGEGRVEIILPTGSTRSADEHKKAWDDLLTKMEVKYKLEPKSLKVPRGQVQKLVEKILQVEQQRIWEKLFTTAESKKDLIERALDPTGKDFKEEPQDLRTLYEELNRERRQVVQRASLVVGAGSGPIGPFSASATLQGMMLRKEKDTGKFTFDMGRMLEHYNVATKSFYDYSKSLQDLMKSVKEDVDDPRKNREIDAWFKQQAWRKMIALLLDKYPYLQQRKSAFDKIAADGIDELVGRAECKGDSTGQAFLVIMEAMAGKDSLTAASKGQYILADRFVDAIELDEKGKPKDDSKFLNADKVLEFVEANYGPWPQKVQFEIEQIHTKSGQSADLTVEEVQRIKDLVSRVGMLEFRILANSVDDKEAIEEIEKFINNAENNDQETKVALIEAQNTGRPPPEPMETVTLSDSGMQAKKKKEYTIKLRNADAKMTYSWVELGPQARQDLGLNNNAPQEGSQGSAWTQMNAKRGQAMKLDALRGSTDKFRWEGALLYSRVCQDRNLPEEERARKKYEYFVLTRNPEIDATTGVPTPNINGDYLKRAWNDQDSSGKPVVSFQFVPAGGLLFRDLTRKNIPSGEGGAQIKRHLAIILDGLIMSAPTINSEIQETGQISGNFTNKEVDQLVNILRAGSLPATLKQQPVSESTMGPTLGRDTTVRGLIAIVVAFVVVLLFMIVYYRFAGLVASVALLANLVLTVGFMLLVQATFTLPGLAGLVLMLGMAVDANILIYERLREERDRGASIVLALRNGYDRAFGTIIDTHLSSIFTAIVLYVVGNDQLKGFGVSLTLGLLISLFTSLYMTRAIFDLWAAKGWLTKLSMFRLFSKPDIDFMGVRYYFFAATAILTILGGALFIGRLPHDLNIDFVGGTAYSGQLIEGQAKSDAELRQLLSDSNQKARLKDQANVVEIDDKKNLYQVSYKDDDPKVRPPRTIALATRPDGETPEERALNVKRRAEDLPDSVVELIFLDNYAETDRNKSRFFTVRSTEKESELVQATLDRLLQYKEGKDEKGQWMPLLKKVEMDYSEEELRARQGTRIRFFESTADKSQGKQVSASPSFVTTLLTRELMRAFDVNDRKDLPVTFELASEDEDPSGDGRFLVAELTFTFKALTSDYSEAERIEKKNEQIQKVVQALRNTADAFNAQPQPERLETFDSQLAAETRLRAMNAVLLSWAAILLYLWFRFGSWTFGLAAVLCLVHDLFFTLGIIAACHYVNQIWPGFLGIQDFKLDLAGVAALLTLVGYSVNDTIVVFDRIREVRGKNPDLTPQIINDSVNQTLSRTLLASLTTWLVVIVLYIWGGPGVHLFAFVMVTGVVVGTYSSIYVASPLLLLFGEGGKSHARAGSGSPTPTSVGPEVRVQPATH